MKRVALNLKQSPEKQVWYGRWFATIRRQYPKRVKTSAEDATGSKTASSNTLRRQDNRAQHRVLATVTNWREYVISINQEICKRHCVVVIMGGIALKPGNSGGVKPITCFVQVVET